jgi:hypothetical protein
MAIFVGINLFTANAIEAKRNNVINECVNLASLAQNYYMKPKALGGGARQFTGWSIPPELQTTTNGSFVETVFGDSVVIVGTGNEVVTNNDSVRVRFTVFPTSFKTIVVN